MYPEEVMGIGRYVGEVRRGPDGNLYQWEESVDGLGNPVGFWKFAKKLVKKALPIASKFIPGVGPVRTAVKQFCKRLPMVKPFANKIPTIKPIYKIGSKVCGALRKVGLAGVEGEIMQAPNGQHYEVVEGLGAYGEPIAVYRPVEIGPRY